MLGALLFESEHESDILSDCISFAAHRRKLALMYISRFHHKHVIIRIYAKRFI